MKFVNRPAQQRTAQPDEIDDSDILGMLLMV